LQQIVDFDAELGTVTLEPGVTQGMLAAFLERERQPFLVPVTGAGPTCSLVGNALERGYGITPFADHFGAVLSLEAVLPDGRVYRRLRSRWTATTRRSSGAGPYLATSSAAPSRRHHHDDRLAGGERQGLRVHGGTRLAASRRSLAASGRGQRINLMSARILAMRGLPEEARADSLSPRRRW
jgi:hypothetical protein